MIVCFCHPTSDKDVERYRANGIRDLQALSRVSNAGRRCAACRHELARLLGEGTPLPSKWKRSMDVPSASVQNEACEGGELP